MPCIAIFKYVFIVYSAVRYWCLWSLQSCGQHKVVVDIIATCRVSLDQVQEQQLQIWQVSGTAETSNGIRNVMHTSMDWFTGKSTGKTIEIFMKIMGVSCKFSLKPIHWNMWFPLRMTFLCGWGRGIMRWSSPDTRGSRGQRETKKVSAPRDWIVLGNDGTWFM